VVTAGEELSALIDGESRARPGNLIHALPSCPFPTATVCCL
jgi:hypothetical protein